MSSSSCTSATIASSGSAFDGGWRRWWAAEAERTGSDWRSLMEVTDQVVGRLRAQHVWVSS
jgi:hypothetical protein